MDEKDSGCMKRAASEPKFSQIKIQPPMQRRRTTTYLDGMYWDPQKILECAATLPNTAQLGLGHSIGPLMRKATLEMEGDDIDLYEAPPRIPIMHSPFVTEEDIKFEKLYEPLKPSVTTFKSMLEQGYTTNLILSICHALIGSFLSGFNTSLLNVPATLVQTECHLTIAVFSSLQSVYCVGGLFGALVAGYFADRFGRKLTLLIANVLFLVSGVIAVLFTFSIFGPMNAPDSFIYFSIARGISGIASGINTAIIPTYLGEIAPVILRGEIGTYNALINAFGILFAEIIGFDRIFGNPQLWQCIFAMNIILPFIQFLAIHKFSRSPKWLLTHKKKEYRDAATIVFQYLRESSNADLDQKLTRSSAIYSSRKKMEYSHKFMRQRSLSGKFHIRKRSHSRSKSKEYQETAGLMGSIGEVDDYGSIEAIKADKNKYDRVVLLYIFFISIFLQILQQFSGINSVWYYSSMMLENAGLHSNVQLWVGNVMIASSNFFGVFIPAQLIEKLGRKWLMYLSCGGMIIASICLSVSLSYGSESEYAGYFSIVLLIGYVISFATGLGPVVGLLVVEVAPTARRGTIMSVAFTFNYLANLFIAQYANVVVMNYYYYPFAAVCLIGIVFTFAMIPETKQKEFEEIQHELRQKATKYL